MCVCHVVVCYYSVPAEFSWSVLYKSIAREWSARQLCVLQGHSSLGLHENFVDKGVKTRKLVAGIKAWLSIMCTRASSFRSAGITCLLESPPIVKHAKGNSRVLWHWRSNTYFATFGKHLTEAHSGMVKGQSNDSLSAVCRIAVSRSISKWSDTEGDMPKCRCAVLGRASQTAATSVCTQQVPLGHGRIEPQDMEDATLLQLDNILGFLGHVWPAQSHAPKELRWICQGWSSLLWVRCSCSFIPKQSGLAFS